MLVDSRDRDRSAHPSASEFSIELPTTLHGVESLALDTWVVPQCPRMVDDHNRDFQLTVQWDPSDPASRRTYVARLPRMQSPSEQRIADAAAEAVRSLPAFAADAAALAPPLYDAAEGRWDVIGDFSSTDLRPTLAVHEVSENHAENRVNDTVTPPVILRYYPYRSLPVTLETPTQFPDAARLWGLDPLAPRADSVPVTETRVFPPGGATAPSQTGDWHVARGVFPSDTEPDHVAVHIEEIGGHPAFGGNACTDKAVAVLLSERKSGIGYDHRATSHSGGAVRHRFVRPIHRLRRLRIRILAPDGRPVDVRGREVLLGLSFRLGGAPPP